MGRPKALQWVAKELLHLGSRAAVGSGTVVRRRTPMRRARHSTFGPSRAALMHIPLWLPRWSKPSLLNEAKAWLGTAPKPTSSP
jgi:hypothetical protein